MAGPASVTSAAEGSTTNELVASECTGAAAAASSAGSASKSSVTAGDSGGVEERRSAVLSVVACLWCSACLMSLLTAGKWVRSQKPITCPATRCTAESGSSAGLSSSARSLRRGAKWKFQALCLPLTAPAPAAASPASSPADSSCMSCQSSCSSDAASAGTHGSAHVACSNGCCCCCCWLACFSEQCASMGEVSTNLRAEAQRSSWGRSSLRASEELGRNQLLLWRVCGI